MTDIVALQVAFARLLVDVVLVFRVDRLVLLDDAPALHSRNLRSVIVVVCLIYDRGLVRLLQGSLSG